VNDLMWYLTRATGIVATVLAVAAVVWGSLFSARETGKRRRPNWWLDLHNWLGGAALAFTAVHIATAYLDRELALDVQSLFVPGIAPTDRLAITWGVIAAWTFAIAVFTSWPTRRFGRRTWRTLHLGSVAGTAFAVVHALQLGTDTGSVTAEVIVLVLVAVGVYAIGVRLFGILLRSR
jgi:methionine sulfoxide reductase heme-binding subunit